MKSIHWQRVLGALEGTSTDAIPISLWKHYHLQDRAPRNLAQVTVDFARRFGIDLIKLTPSGLYGVQDWGVGLQFGQNDAQAPSVISSPIGKASDWLDLRPLSPTTGALCREIEMCSHVGKLLRDEVPFMMTLFSPLTLAQKLAGDQVFDHLRQEPAILHKALKVIRDTVVTFARSCLEAGVPGFFLATQQASHRLLTVAQFKEFGLSYDQDVAAEIEDAPIRMLHICGEEIMFAEASEINVNCLSWSAGGTNPDLSSARQLSKKTLAAGLSLETLAGASSEDCRSMVSSARDSDLGPGLILAPDCVVRLESPDANLDAVVEAARA